MNMFRAPKYSKSCAFAAIVLSAVSDNSDTLINILMTGIRMGKLSMAVKVPLLLARDAMAEIMVKVVENARAPNSIAAIKERLSSTGYPWVAIYMMRARELSTIINMPLYNIRAIIMDSGEASVYIYNCLPSLSCRKLLATALTLVKRMAIQNKTIQVLSSVSSNVKEMIMMILSRYMRMPLMAYLLRYSSRISFFIKVGICCIADIRQNYRLEITLML
jgi:hypothetical protein